MVWRLLAVGAVVAVGMGGCGGGDAGDRSSAEPALGPPPDNHATPSPAANRHPSAAPATDSAPCPPTGRWAECSVIERLEKAGLRADTSHPGATEPPLARDGIRITVRSADLELYLYPDRASRERDEARLDRSRYLAAEQPPEPRHKPTLVTSENLLVILDTRNQRQRERITLAITAGPPQPPAP